MAGSADFLKKVAKNQNVSADFGNIPCGGCDGRCPMRSGAEKKNATFFGNLYRISVFGLIYRMCGIGRGRRMQRKKVEIFSENSIGFRFCAQIYPVCGTSHRTVGDVKSDDFFENLYRIAEKFADIPCVQVMRAGRMPWVVAKKRDFFAESSAGFQKIC